MRPRRSDSTTGPAAKSLPTSDVEEDEAAPDLKAESEDVTSSEEMQNKNPVSAPEKRAKTASFSPPPALSPAHSIQMENEEIEVKMEVDSDEEEKKLPKITEKRAKMVYKVRQACTRNAPTSSWCISRYRTSKSSFFAEKTRKRERSSAIYRSKCSKKKSIWICAFYHVNYRFFARKSRKSPIFSDIAELHTQKPWCHREKLIYRLRRTGRSLPPKNVSRFSREPTRRRSNIWSWWKNTRKLTRIRNFRVRCAKNRVLRSFLPVGSIGSVNFDNFRVTVAPKVRKHRTLYAKMHRN